jgi:hypothetical protein
MPDPAIGVDQAAPDADRTIVRFKRNEGDKWTYVVVPSAVDWASVCERVRREIFPGAQPPKDDAVFEMLMKRRKKKAAGG